MMHAITQKKYGDESTLSLSQVPSPKLKKQNDVKVAVHYVNLTAGDAHINTMDLKGPIKLISKLLFGWNGPRQRIRGITGSGIVTEIGPSVKRLKVGDSVIFIQSLHAGVCADEVIIREGRTIQKVDEALLKEAATLPFGYLSAMHFMHADSIQPGMKVMILGASGSVGSAAVDIAKKCGASVTAVLRSKNVKAISSLMPDDWFDYQSNALLNAKPIYDIVFDAVGHYSKKTVKGWLKPGGKWMSIKSPTKESAPNLSLLIAWLKTGHIHPIIEHVYKQAEYKKAFQHLYSGHKVGNVMIEWRTPPISIQ